MKNKIVGIFVMTLLIITAVVPLVSSVDKNDSSQVFDEVYIDDDCECRTKSFGKDNLPTPLYLKDTSPKPITMDTPDYFSWKDYNGEDWTTPAKDQTIPQYCGSCWIFAAVGALESVINIREGSAVIDPDLSEQYVLSCLPEAALTPGKGCWGGYAYDVFLYIMDTSPSGNNCNGIIWETCFPYQAVHYIPCDDKCSDWEDYLVPINDHGYWIFNRSNQSIEVIKTQIMQGGPVAACMLWTLDFSNWGKTHHDPDDYYPYTEGDVIYDHDVVVLGWKDDPMIPNGGYWICKNSKGPEFGYDGFFNMEYGLLGSLWIDEDPDTTYVVWVDYDHESFYWPNEPDPPGAPDIDGPPNGKLGSEYSFTFNAVDPNGDNVKYHIDWDDGDSDETGLNPSGDDVKLKHTWNSEGTYTIRAYAEDEFGLVGPESTFEIIITKKTRAINTPFQRFLQQYLNLFPLLQKILLLQR